MEEVAPTHVAFAVAKQAADEAEAEEVVATQAEVASVLEHRSAQVGPFLGVHYLDLVVRLELHQPWHAGWYLGSHEYPPGKPHVPS